ncbi:MAG: ATPase [archaeon GW2011_AR3]|nr:MAG: ATPase [archaeon GW2011_AR3]
MFFLANRKDQEHLVSRRFYLDKLSEFAGQGKNVALVGPHKSGKTSLLKEILLTLEKDNGLLPVYIGLNRTSTPPENFSIELTGGICFWSLKAFPNQFLKFQNIDHLLSLREKIGKNAAAIIDIINAELQKIKPDQKLMVGKAFEFASEIAKFNKKRLVLILDDFDSIFEINNFSQIKDVLSLINFRDKNVTYMISTSYKKMLLDNLGDKAKDFSVVEMLGLTSEETQKIAGRIIGTPQLDKKVLDDILDMTHGIPILVNALSARYKQMHDVRKAFLVEMTYRNSTTWQYLDSMLNDFFYHARGESMPKTVIKVMAFMKDARLTEISRKIYRTAPVTKSLLERIMQVGMISKVENKYQFSNAILKQWLRLVHSGLEFDDIPSDEILRQAEEVLNEPQ